MKKREIFFLLYAIVIAFSTFSGVLRFGIIVYLVLVLLFFAICILTSSGRCSVKLGSKGIFGFLLVCTISILINNPPSYFRVWERLAIFLMVVIAFSPLILGNSFNRNRVLLFNGLVKVMALFAVASFFGYFLGINFFIRNGELLDYTEAGHFSGFANHSMVLAPISAIASIYGVSKMLSLGNKGNHKFFWWVITLTSIGSVLLSASRGALAGLVLGIVVSVYRHSGSRMGKFVQYGLVVVALASLTFPLWGGLADPVMEKYDYNISQGGMAYSREDKMAARMYEIRNNFISGVGFSVVDETVDSVDHMTGTIEPNSSWLGVFSMTGVFGFLIFLGIFIKSFWTAYKKIPDNEIAVFLCGLLSFFVVHLMIEGYVLAGGNFLCGFYWLTLGIVFAYSSLYKKRIVVVHQL